MVCQIFALITNIADFTRLSEFLNRFHDISFDSRTTLDEKIWQLTDLTAGFLDLHCGLFARLDDTTYRVVSSFGIDPEVLGSGVFDLAQTYCEEAVRRRDVVCVEHAAQQGWSDRPAYQMIGWECYIGVPVLIGDKVCGTFCFGGTTPRPTPFTAVDTELMRLIARWLGAELAREAAEQGLRAEKDKALTTLQSIADAVISTDAEGRIDFLNRAAEALTGFAAAEAVGQPLGAVFVVREEATRADLGLGDPAGAAGTSRSRAESHFVLADRHGATRAIEQSTAPIHHPEGRTVGTVVVFRDVSETRRLTNRLAHEASHDALTGLINRRAFEARLDRAISSARTTGACHALCYLDLDNFKAINTAAGHGAGDAVLRQMRGLMRGAFRDRDTFARIGGDEFALLLDNCALDEAVRIANVVVQRLRDQRFFWRGHGFDVGVSVGVVAIDRSVDSSSQALRKADQACFMAKTEGRSRVHVGADGDGRDAGNGPAPPGAAWLHQALASNRLCLYGEPIVALSSAAGAVIRYEVAPRLRIGDGAGSDGEAMAFDTDQAGGLVEVDRWVIDQALDRYCSRNRRLWPGGVAVNVSRAAVTDRGFVTDLKALLTAKRVVPAELWIEVSERMVSEDVRAAAAFATALRALGCHVVVDDFGSQPSALDHLRAIPANGLKLSGRIVRRVAEDPIDRALLAAARAASASLNLESAAAAADNDAVVATLRAAGVDVAQGTALGAPCVLDRLSRADLAGR